MKQHNLLSTNEPNRDDVEAAGNYERTRSDLAEVPFSVKVDSLPTNPSDQSQVLSFFHGRYEQIKKARAGFNGFLDRAFGKEMAGTKISGAKMLKARLNPTQLKLNTQHNLGFREGPDWGKGGALDNPTLRAEFYRKALKGDELAEAHLRRYDKNFGESEESYKDAILEAAAIFSGAALVYRVGSTALAGIMLGRALLKKDEGERDAGLENARKFIEDRSPMLGSKKAEARKEAYARLAQGKSGHHGKDIFAVL